LIKLEESDLLGESEEVEGFKFLENGDLYKGNWVKDLWMGRGLCIYSDGSMYQGEFVNDLPDGSGILKTKKGEIFEGEFFKSTLKSGFAWIMYANGDYYEGMTDNGWRHG